MSVDLINETGNTFRTGNRSWRKIFILAQMYGWEPACTLSPPDWDDHPRLKDEPWDGGYFTNDGQVVTSPDAHNLAAALEEALLDITDEIPAEEVSGQDPIVVLFQEILTREMALKSGIRSPALIEVASLYKDKIRELIDFCRQGSFQIY